MLRSLAILPLLMFFAGCASNPNSRWFERGMMNYEVLEIGPKQYKLTAIGAGAHSSSDVERGYLVRARELCSGQEPSREFQTISYQYGSSGGGYSFTHNAFKTTGTVQCK